ncbi:MAG: SIR2 family protein, partial [Parvibaculum sp.]|nr:SIR2 family protein [Parvibaculum sp.]
QPTPIVFSEQVLGDDQKNVLIGAYGEADYELHREEICQTALIQAYAKPLLLALLLHVLTAKLEVLASDAQAANLNPSERAAVVEGIRALRDRVAEAGDADRLALAHGIAAGLARARHQLQNGTSDAGVQVYFPLDSEPSHRMKNKLALKSSGQREVAVALGLIGIEEQTASWVSSVDDPADPRTGALRLTSSNGSARVFFAANDDTVSNLLDAGAFEEVDDDAVVICSGRVSERQQRNPASVMRDGALSTRYVAFGPMLGDIADLNDLRDRFRGEVGL